MLKYFQKYSFASIYITIFFLILLWLNSLLRFGNDVFISESYTNTPIFDWIDKGIGNLYVLKSFISLVLFGLQTFILVNISLKFDVFDKNTFIGGFVFVILSGFAYIQQFNGVLFANVFLFLGIFLLLKINAEKKSLISVFNIGLLFAVASLFYFPYILLLLFGVISLLIVRSKVTKEIITFVVGFIVTYIFYVEILYLSKIYIDLNVVFVEYLTHTSYEITFNKLYFFIYTALLFFLSNAYIILKINTKEIEKRTIYQLFFALFIFFLAMNFVFNQAKYELIFATFFPISILFGNYFAKIRLNRVSNVLFYLFILNSLVFQFLVYFL